MRRWVMVIGAVVLAAAAYWSWPLASAALLARAAKAGDVAGVMERVDVDLLRRSLSRQIALAYLDVSGKGRKMGAFGRGVAGAAATTVADPYVADLLTPANVLALLTSGRVERVEINGRSVEVKGNLPGFAPLLDDRLLSAVTGSYFDQIKDFVIPLDGGHGADDRYSVHLHLVGLTWKLGGIDLPTPVVDTMARSILNSEPPATL